MTLSDFSQPTSPSTHNASPLDPATFSQLYDQYASALLGVIAAIVCDETEALRLLEITFTRIRLQFSEPRSKNQPLFVWLLSIARATALDARKSHDKMAVPVFRLTDSGKVVRETATPGSSTTFLSSTSTVLASSTQALLNAVLFKNCTPEEAASSIGMPVATARQQLREAVQQLRTPNIA